jgi:ethanolamine ammonia-lyase small subunit
VTHPAEREAVASTEPASLLSAARARTPARVFRGRLDGGYTTASHLALRADHAAARDAVHAALDLELGPVVAERRLLALLDAIHAAGRSGVTVKEPSEPANAGALTS